MRGEPEQESIAYVTAHMPVLRRLAYRLSGDWRAADDLPRDCLVMVYRHWRRVSAAASVDAYVRTMLVRTYLRDRGRPWRRRVQPRAEVPEPEPDRHARRRDDCGARTIVRDNDFTCALRNGALRALEFHARLIHINLPQPDLQVRGRDAIVAAWRSAVGPAGLRCRFAGIPTVR